MHIRRRDFLKRCGLGLAIGLPLGIASAQARAQSLKKRPNILFICTDYQSGADGPSLGSPFLDMPALDRLCKEGMVFARHYSTAPICIPARYTWISGRYPHYHGAWDNVGHWLPEGTPILMELLQKAGYHTVGVGKMHFKPWNREAGFDRWISADRKGNGKRDAEFRDDYAKFLAKHGMTRWDYLKLQKEAEIFGVYDWPFDEKLHIDHFVGSQAKGVIERGELTEPFFMWVSFNGPHNPWDPPAKYSDPYKNMDLPLGHSFPGELKTKPRDHTRTKYNYTPQVTRLIDRQPEKRDRIVHRIRAGHYGNLTFIDRQVEGLFAVLEAKGLMDKTVIIYSSDHGAHLGDHDAMHKGTHYDSSARVPFVLRYPKKIKPQVTQAFSGHVDLMPTILELADTPAPPALEGRSLVPVLFGHRQKVQDQVFIEIRGTTSIVTDRWKLGINPKDQDGDLYDLKNDPHELRNLFGRPEVAAVQADLTQQIVAFNPQLKDTLDNAAWLRTRDE
jgi:arylsulfatase